MKVLVIGGSSALAHALKQPLSAFAEIVTAGRSGGDLDFDLGNIPQGFELPSDVDVVINAAADFGGKTIEDFERAARVNVLGTLALSRLCVEAGVRHLVLVSSIFALLDRHSPFFSAYALSKRQSEEWAEFHASQSGLPLTIVRPSQFYGPGAAGRRHQPFLSTIIERARSHENILIYGGNDALRNFIHIDDVAEVIARIVDQGVVGTYGCMSLENQRYSQIAAAAIAAFSSRSAVEFLSDKSDIPDNAFDPDEKLYRMIGYFPRISIEMAMRMEAERFREGLE